MNCKSYSELMALESYSERLEYLKLYSINPGNIDRSLMNNFYKSNQWIKVRDEVLLRDLGCDLGIQNLFIEDSIIIHHINPITEDDVINGSYKLIDPENLICVSFDTHNKIHYSKNKNDIHYVERKPGDTKLW